MSYSRNFGMRSFENVVRDARFRVPQSGTPLLIGAPVTINSAAAGFLKVAGSGQAPSPGCGAVVFEHIQHKGVDTFLTTNHDAPYNTVPLGQYAQMMHGVGTKVWLKNSAASTLYDGRTQAAVTMITGTLPVAGESLTPNGDGTWKVATGGATPTAAWLYVEQVNSDSGLVEARFTF